MIETTDFLKLAKLMKENATTEPEFRSIISRAYYAVYLYISDKLSLQNYGVSAHQDLIKKLKYNKKTFHVGSDLEKLHKKRKEADY